MNFKLSNLKKDYNILLKAKEDSNNYLNNIDLYNDSTSKYLKNILYELKNMD